MVYGKFNNPKNVPNFEHNSDMFFFENGLVKCLNCP